MSVHDDGAALGRLRNAEARIADLEAGLRRYGEHETGCPVGDACSCGLRTLLRGPLRITWLTLEPPGPAACPTCGSTDRAVSGPLCAIFGRFGAEPDAWHGGEEPA